MLKVIEKRVCQCRDEFDAVKICARHEQPMRYFGKFYSPLIHDVSKIDVKNPDANKEIIDAFLRIPS